MKINSEPLPEPIMEITYPIDTKSKNEWVKDHSADLKSGPSGLDTYVTNNGQINIFVTETEGDLITSYLITDKANILPEELTALLESLMKNRFNALIIKLAAAISESCFTPARDSAVPLKPMERKSRKKND